MVLETHHHESNQISDGHLILKNFPRDVFIDDEVKQNFENLFKGYHIRKFTYLPSFNRVILSFDCIDQAKKVQAEFQEVVIDNHILKVYLKEEAKRMGDSFLALPKSEKLFLISPPASPPVGWEPISEPIPVVNYDLVGALASLEASGKPVELVSQTYCTPGIVVVGCEDPISRTGTEMISMKSVPADKLQTKRPPEKI